MKGPQKKASADSHQYIDKEEIKEFNEVENELKSEIQFLQYELSQAQDKLVKSEKNEDILASLFEKGLIDEKGCFIEHHK